MGKKRHVLTEKSLRWKNLLAWQTIVFVKQENIEKKFNKAYYGENEIVTLVNIFVGGTFPFQQGIFMQSWKGRWYVRSIFPKLVNIDIPSAYAENDGGMEIYVATTTTKTAETQRKRGGVAA